MKAWKIAAPLLLCLCLSGCFEGNEPNNIAYVTAVGLDKAEDGNYEMTIQFARTNQISGGSSEEGGKGGEIVENITVEAPTLYAGLDIANQIVSKTLSLAHMKLFVFSEEIAREGVANITETMARSDEVRPNIYMAVAPEGAKKYLKEVKPVVEINPAKYYQLVFEKHNFGGIPKNVSQDFYFYQDTHERNTVLPLVGVIESGEEKKGGEQSGGGGGSSGGGGGSSGGGGGSSGGGSSGGGEGGASGSNDSVGKGSSTNEKQKEAQVNESGFEFHVKNYYAGQVGIEEENKSESMGMAVFYNDKMIGKLGSIDSELYNLLAGSFDYSYVTFHSGKVDKPVTIRLEQEEKPKVDYDRNRNKVKIILTLEADLISLISEYVVEENLQSFEEMVKNSIASASEEFLYKTSRDFGSDIIGIGSTVKSAFLTHQQFSEYGWEEKYKTITFDIDVHFKVRRTGLTIRTEEQ